MNINLRHAMSIIKSSYIVPCILSLFVVGMIQPQTLRAEEANTPVQTTVEDYCSTGKLVVDKSMTNKRYQVVHVSSDDVLNIRKGAGHTQDKIGELQYNARDLSLTGRLCLLGSNRWTEINTQGTSGWVNEYYIHQQMVPKVYSYPTTSPIDITANYKNILSSYDSVVELVTQIVDPNQPRIVSEPDAEILLKEQVSSIVIEGNQATVIIEHCCAPDDSVAGNRKVLQLQQENNLWSLEKAIYATLCYRGSHGSSCL